MLFNRGVSILCFWCFFVTCLFPAFAALQSSSLGPISLGLGPLHSTDSGGGGGGVI